MRGSRAPRVSRPSFQRPLMTGRTSPGDLALEADLTHGRRGHQGGAGREGGGLQSVLGEGEGSGVEGQGAATDRPVVAQDAPAERAPGWVGDTDVSGPDLAVDAGLGGGPDRVEAEI